LIHDKSRKRASFKKVKPRGPLGLENGTTRSSPARLSISRSFQNGDTIEAIEARHVPDRAGFENRNRERAGASGAAIRTGTKQMQVRPTPSMTRLPWQDDARP
jgi:hypothetical protein